MQRDISNASQKIADIRNQIIECKSEKEAENKLGQSVCHTSKILEDWLSRIWTQMHQMGRLI